MKALIVAFLAALVTAHTAHLHEPHLDAHTDDVVLLTSHDLHALPQTAVCLMRSHAPQYSTQGYIRFSQTRISTEDAPTQTVIAGRLTGLTPNQKHAFHIHELGDLTDGCMSLAGHYNPNGETHGGPESCHRHVGDLGNLQANEEGVAEFEFVDNKIKLDRAAFNYWKKLRGPPVL